MDGFERDSDDLTDEAEDVLGIVGAVGVVGDAGATVGRDLVLVNDPFEGGAVAEAVFIAFERNALEGESVVVKEDGFVFVREAHFGDAVVELGGGLPEFFEREFGLLFVVDVDVG